MLDNLEATINQLPQQKALTEWGDYYENTNYSSEAFIEKKKQVEQFVDTAKPESVWDLGANMGEFSRVASEKNIPTVAFDIDPIAVEKNYAITKKKNEKNILPLIMDLTNPSPSIGWMNNERDSLVARGTVDMVFALALIHHLAISNNLPLERIAAFFSVLCKYAVVEFVPKSDSQVKRLLASRVDIFPNYDVSGFESAFNIYFEVVQKVPLTGSQRILYLLKKK